MSTETLVTSINQSSEKRNATTDWQQAKLLTKIALDNEDYDAVIGHSSATVDDLQKRLVHLLKMRVTAWGQKGQYDQELKEASEIMQYAPHDPMGYLCAGSRYADQGHQTKAIEIFNKGLRNVPQNNIQYKTLYAAKQHALKRYSQRIDIIAKVPFDIVTIILDQIPPKTLALCVEVSPIWRQKLLEYPGCWRKIRIDDFVDEIDGYHTLSRVCRILPRISHYVRELSLPHAPLLPRSLELIGSKNFSCLQSLKIRKPDIDEYKYEDYCEPLQTCLQNIAESLTSLHIQYYGDDTVYLSQILNTCRKLTTVVFHNEGHRRALAGLALPFDTSLRKVVLAGSLHSSDLVSLFRCSPNLRYLALSKSNDHIYTAIGEHCPDTISILKIGYETLHLNDVFDSDSDNSTGLTNLCASNPQSSRIIASLINKFSTTLRYLRISFPRRTHGHSRENWGTLSSFALAGLTSLSFENVPQSVTTDLPSLFEQCSKLETISLKMMNSSIPKRAFIAASQLRHLTSLRLKGARFSEESILQFLSAVEHQQNGSRGLMDLRLIDGGDINGPVLAACASIKSLTSLAIRYPIMMEPSDEQNFAVGLERLPRLQKLYLANLTLSKQSLLTISKNKSLKEVELNNIYQLTAMQIQDAFPSHVTLKFKEYDSR
ncbi:hypothetical protein BJV82DRAFT_664261 [Fennellomyces sp. T-0311]|nr:hypothetical protein BJV82DRAFT_664261 [Fennellomyces sp. T-0311]